MGVKGFIPSQRAAQAAFFRAALPAEVIHDAAAYRLKPDFRHLNLAPAIQGQAATYFAPPRNIVWHRHANHGLSSQACCLNFLMPLATQPRLLGQIVSEALRIGPVEVFPIETGPGGKPWHVAFEWIGASNYLNEWKIGASSATRGANVTSADAAVRFRHDGVEQTLLIEWKYTESYGQPLDPAGNPTRLQRYQDRFLAPDGPIRADMDLSLEDFFWEPFYQLLRQQMLAWQMERAKEDGARKVTVLHLAPIANTALRAVTSPHLRQFGDWAMPVFASLLAEPDRFVSRDIADVFGPFVVKAHAEPAALEWASYIRSRYNFLQMDRG